MISSDKAGVQFPDSESSFCFCSTVTNDILFSFGCMFAWRRAGYFLLPKRISAPTQHQVRCKAYTPITRRPRETSGAMASAIQERTAHRHQDGSSLIVINVFRSHRSRSTLASPHGDTSFNSWLRTRERVFSGPWLANKTEKMAKITWQKLDVEISDLAMEDWGKAQEPG
jgi:hypothetical protein